MRGNRTLVIVALLLIVAVVIASVVYFYLQSKRSAEQLSVEGAPTAVAVETTEIVVALQTIPRGMKISVEDNAVALQQWPIDSLPPAYLSSLDDVDGKFARMEIPRGMPVVPAMLGEPGGMLSVTGSAASLFEPADRVAYAIPLDTQGAVGWAIQPGDRVDVIAALKMEPVYTDFLDTGVKEFTYLQSGGEEDVAQTSPFGSFELLPNGRWAAVYPSEAGSTVEPALLVQMTVQDAIVWHVGIWESEMTSEVQPVVETQGEEAGPLGGPALAQPTPVSVAMPVVQDLQLVTLLVTREDALILKYLYEIGADLDLVLRPAGTTGPVLQTQPIWFRYIVDKYQLPDTMPSDPIGPVPIHPPLEMHIEPTPAPAE